MGIVMPTENKIDLIFNEIPNSKKVALDKVLKEKASESARKLALETHIAGGLWINVYNKNKDENGICQAEISYSDIYKFYKGYYSNVSSI